MTLAPRPSGPETVRKGLSRMRRALARSGHPESAFRTFHVAGTNGKGSTACFLEAILREISGVRVGLYTSPHLLSPEERIRADGAKIPSRALREGFRTAAGLGRRQDPLTYFETMTWVACDWFRRTGTPLVVMETGLGGRWDATTACRPIVSVIPRSGSITGSGWETPWRGSRGRRPAS
jgi:dihydrofolate synthase/folylpolyglutamate synthase